MVGISILLAPLAAFLIGLVTVPAVQRMAFACGFLDVPDQLRKLQTVPIALGGGIAVWLATWCGWGISHFGSSRFAGSEPDSIRFVQALGWSSLLMLCVGIIDDRYVLRARYKLAGQVMVAVVMLALGVRIDAWSCLGVVSPMGVLAYPVTVFWIVLVVNAFNLIDGMDGFCSVVGLIASLTIAFLAWSSGQSEDSALALSLAGGLTAFLAFNLPPAKIYLGDAGSMTIGLIISALTVRCCGHSGGSTISLVPASALLIVPLLDVVAAVGRRSLNRQSIFSPDLGHIHHCLRNRAGSVPRALFLMFMLAVFGAGVATLTVTYGVADRSVFPAVAFAVGLLGYTNTFGANELRLLAFRVKTLFTLLLCRYALRDGHTGNDCGVLRETDWTDLWDALVGEAKASGVYRLEMQIDVKASPLAFHRYKSLSKASEATLNCTLVHTLYAGTAKVGSISATGNAEIRNILVVEEVAKRLRTIEHRLATRQRVKSSAMLPSLPMLGTPTNSAQRLERRATDLIRVHNSAGLGIV